MQKAKVATNPLAKPVLSMSLWGLKFHSADLSAAEYELDVMLLRDSNGQCHSNTAVECHTQLRRHLQHAALSEIFKL
jgi:hypothetical protein